MLRDQLSIPILHTRVCAIFIFKATVQLKGVSGHICLYAMIPCLVFFFQHRGHFTISSLEMITLTSTSRCKLFYPEEGFYGLINSLNSIQELSFALCHVYAKATRSVSIPAPLYCKCLSLSRFELSLANHLSPLCFFFISTDADVFPLCRRLPSFLN